METMLAYRLLEWQQPPPLGETDVPRPGLGKGLVEVAGNGLCHSDLTMMQMPREIGEMIDWHMPFTLGHEGGGPIAEVGAHVTGFDVGEAVALTSPSSRGMSAFCLRGRDSACRHGL